MTEISNPWTERTGGFAVPVIGSRLGLPAQGGHVGGSGAVDRGRSAGRGYAGGVVAFRAVGGLRPRTAPIAPIAPTSPLTGVLPARRQVLTS